MEDKNYPIEHGIDSAMKAAYEAGAQGNENPNPFIEKAHLAGESAVAFFETEKNRVTSEIEEKERDAVNLDGHLKKLNAQILDDWNMQSRLVTNRSEAETAITRFDDEERTKADFWTILTYILFGFEFIFGFWIFKTYVLPDNEFGNYLTSLLVGGMVLAIGFFLKIWPDATMSDANYARWKRWLASFAAIFAVIFLVLLASMREVSDTLTLTASAENPGGGTFSYKAISNFLFQISLLLSLIFAASFFAHWRRTSPKKLMRAMSLEGRALLSMYDADPYFYGKKRSDYDDLIRGISSRKSAREIFQKKLSYYSGKKLSLLKKEACVAFIDGTISPPQTDAKKRANDNAQRILAQLSGNKGSS